MGLVEAVALELSLPTNEPATLSALRRDALTRARHRGLPTVHQEDWKYTDLAVLQTLDFTPAVAPRAVPTLPLIMSDAYRITFINGHLLAHESNVDDLPVGCKVRTISDVTRDEPAAFEASLRRSKTLETKVLPALNVAAAGDGISIQLAANCVVDRPLVVTFMNDAQESTTWSAPRIIVEAGAHSQLTLIEMHAGGDHAYCTNAFTYLATSVGAQIQHYRITADGPAATHLGQVEIELGRDAHVSNFVLAVGGRLVRVDIDCELAAPGASVTLKGIFIASDGQHVDHHTRVDHRASDTTSDEIYKGIASGDGRGVFNGKVVAHAGTQRIAATQTSNNLLLSSTAEIDTKPELEIYTNDIRCTHGATLGQLDEDALFYLQARGIPRADAEALTTFGFVHALVSEIPYPEVRALAARRVALSAPALAGVVAGLTL